MENNNKMNNKRIEELKAKYLKSQYVRKEWTVDPNDDLTLEEYGKYIDPTFKHVVGNPTIIAKQRKNGNWFYKMSIPIEGDCEVEYDLSYNKEDSDYFEEGDEVDLSTLMFRTEKFLEKEHCYATGDVAD